MTSLASESRNGVAGPWSAAIDALFARFEQPGRPGLNLAVTLDGKVVHQRGYGLTNVEDGVPFRPDTRLNLGSTTKHMCAAAMLILEDRGLLSLDDPVRLHITELPAWADAISLRHLLTMTSGLPDGLNWPLFCGLPEGSPLAAATHLDILTRLPAPMFAPGAAMTYSNSNYLLLSLVVERLSGLDLASFLKRELFEPLGMTSTDLVSDQSRVLPNRARGYHSGPDDSLIADPPMGGLCGDGGVISTIEDMLKWLAHYAANRTLGDRLETVGVLNDGTRTNYGLGMTVSDLGGRRKVSHAGGMPGYLCDFAWYPSERIGVILLTNVMDVGVFEAADQIADLIAPRPVEAETAGTPVADLTGLWVNHSFGCTLEFEATGEALFLHIMGERLRLTTDDNTAFRPTKAGSPYRVTREDAETLTVEIGGAGPLLFTRFEAPGPIVLDDYLGSYDCALLGETHVITRREGGLHIGLPPGVRALIWGDLEPRGEEVFSAVIPGEPNSTDVTLKFRRDASGRVVGFDYNLSRTRGLSFERREA
jgi:CubicO group peptidase (beta-lactamase class C family)